MLIPRWPVSASGILGGWDQGLRMAGSFHLQSSGKRTSTSQRVYEDGGESSLKALPGFTVTNGSIYREYRYPLPATRYLLPAPHQTFPHISTPTVSHDLCPRWPPAKHLVTYALSSRVLPPTTLWLADNIMGSLLQILTFPSRFFHFMDRILNYPHNPAN